MRRLIQWVLLGALAAASAGAAAQSARTWRCPGNYFTNDAGEARQRGGCKPLDGGNVVVVPGGEARRAAPAPSVPRAPSGAAAGSSASRSTDMRVTTEQQRQRDSDAKLLLQAELAKQQQQLAELQKDYNNGQPEKQGIEARNYQRYLDRVAEMKRNIERKQADIAAIQQELGKLR